MKKRRRPICCAHTPMHLDEDTEVGIWCERKEGHRGSHKHYIILCGFEICISWRENIDLKVKFL